MPVAANVVTSSRILLSVLFSALVSIETPTARHLSFLIIILITISEVLDGHMARRVRAPIGPKPIGSVFDSMADDIAFAASFISLYSKALVPLWFVLMTVWVRTLLAMMRLLSTVQGDSYPGPRISTKIKGATYYIGMILLTAAYAFPSLSFFAWIQPLIVTIMTTSTIVATLDFFTAHRAIIARLFQK